MIDASTNSASFGGFGGLRPTQIRARTMEALQEVAATVGIPSRIVKKIADAAEMKPINGLGDWIQRALAKLSDNGVIAEVPQEVLAWLSFDRIVRGNQPEDVIGELDDGSDSDEYGSDELSQILQILAMSDGGEPQQEGADAYAEPGRDNTERDLRVGATGTGLPGGSDPVALGQPGYGRADAGATSPGPDAGGLAAPDEAGAVRPALTFAEGQPVSIGDMQAVIVSARPGAVVVEDASGRRRTIAEGSAGWARMSPMQPQAQIPAPQMAQPQGKPQPAPPGMVPDVADQTDPRHVNQTYTPGVQQSKSAPAIPVSDLGSAPVSVMDAAGNLTGEVVTLDDVMSEIAEHEASKQSDSVIQVDDEVLLLGDVYTVVEVDSKGVTIKGKDRKKKFVKRGSVNWGRMMILRQPEDEAKEGESADNALAYANAV